MSLTLTGNLINKKNHSSKIVLPYKKYIFLIVTLYSYTKD